MSSVLWETLYELLVRIYSWYGKTANAHTDRPPECRKGTFIRSFASVIS